MSQVLDILDDDERDALRRLRRRRRDRGLRARLGELLALLCLEGHRLDALPLRTRKGLLKRALDYSGRLRYMAHRNGRGEACFAAACDKGWHGVIAKRADSTCHHGRSSNWLRFKCSHGQELVIGGFTEWTKAGKLRHPTVLGLRRDRTAHDVVREHAR